MASIISYLENYVESTLGLPSDLSRFLNMIKVRARNKTATVCSSNNTAGVSDLNVRICHSE
jgi:hypothetical protein